MLAILGRPILAASKPTSAPHSPAIEIGFMRITSILVRGAGIRQRINPVVVSEAGLEPATVSLEG